MAKPILFSIFENHVPPRLSGLCERLDIEEVGLGSVRKAISQLKKQTPDFVLAEFKYGYSNNYSGVHISNLDVFLVSLKKYAPQARVIVVAEQDERPYVEKLTGIMPLQGVIVFPIQEQALTDLLQDA